MTYSVPQIEVVNNAAVTTSLAIAEYFGKQHYHVLRDIRELEISDSFRLSNFGESSYLNQQGKKQPLYYMTKNGFMFLVMGFTGEEAGRIKEAYINAFDQMEAQLHKPTVSSIEAETESTISVKKYVTLQEKYSELQEKYIALQEKLQTHELKNATVESPKPLRRRRLTEEMIQQILELYQQGYTQTEIARVVGYSTATISVVVRQRRNH
jgi:Rha family phage regulatory protein